MSTDTYTNAVNNAGELGNEVQAEFMQNFTEYLTNTIKQSLNGSADDTELDATSIVELMASSASKAGVSDDFVSQLRSLSSDPEMLSALQSFEADLSGTGSGNLSPQSTILPDFESTLANKLSPNDNNGNLHSLYNGLDYITNGNAAATNRAISSGPSLLNSAPNSIINAMLFKHKKFVYKVDKQVKQLNQIAGQSSFWAATGEIDKQMSEFRNQSLLKAKDSLSTVGDGVKVYGSLIGLVGSADSLVGGSKDGDARVITAGALGLTSGLYQLTDFVAGKVVKNAGADAASDVATFLSKSAASDTISKVGWSGASRLTKAGAGFAIGVGSALAVGMGVTSMVKNAKKAAAANGSGNTGKAAVYGIMTALDGISMVLDVASLVCDFVPGIGTLVSAVLDVVNFAVNLVNMALEFIADLVDNRTDEQKLQESFDTYLESEGFKNFIQQQADFYKEKGYDVFQYVTDAEAAGLEEGDADGTKIEKTITKELNEKAEQNVNDENLRLALLDASSIGRTLTGRENDDYISGMTGDDVILGLGGNDILFGGSGSDTIEGGDGDDNINGGSGGDTIDGGAGNDVVRGGIGADIITLGADNDTIIGLLGDDQVDGGSGNDTVHAEELFKNIDGKDYDIDWKTVDDIEAAVYNSNNWQDYQPQTEPELGYNVDLAAKTGRSNPNYTPINDIPNGGLYNHDLFPGNNEWNSHLRDFSSAQMLSSLPGLSVISQLRDSATSSYIAYYHHTSWNSYLFSDTPDSQIKQGYDAFIQQAQNNNRNVYLIGETNITLDPDFGIYPGMQVLTDGKQLMLFDPVMGYVTIDHDDLVQMVGGAEGNFASAAGFYLYLLEKIGVSASLENLENIVGSSFDDILAGTDEANQLSAQQGDDQLYGRGGDDLLDGSQAGNNTLDGGQDNDTAAYSLHDQGVTASLVSNTVSKGNGTDTLVAIENLMGTDHNDTLTGDDQNNRLFGMAGVDQIAGGKGHDLIDGGAGSDQLDGGEGTDTLSYASSESAVSADLASGSNSDGDTLSGFENLMGGEAGDTLQGDANSNTLFGNDGNDTLEGRAGDDTLLGGQGSDTLRGGSDNDRLSGGAGVDTLDGGTGADALDYSLSEDDSKRQLEIRLADGQAYGIEADGSKTLLDNFSNIEQLIGGDKDDTLIGDDNKNTLRGGAGNDILRGGGDNDILVADGGIDQLYGDDGVDIYQVKADTGVRAIIDETDQGNALLLEGIVLSDLGIRFDASSQRLQLFDRRNDQVLVEDVESGRQAGQWSGDASADQTLALLFDFASRFSTIRINNSVLNADQVADWLGNQLVSIPDNSTGNALANLIEADQSVNQVNAGAGEDRILVKSGTATINTGSGNDYTDFTGNTDIKAQTAQINIQGFDVIEAAAGDNLQINKQTSTAQFGLVLNAEINDWHIATDGQSLRHKDGGLLQLPERPTSLVFVNGQGQRLLINDINAYYQSRQNGQAFTTYWELAHNDHSIILNLTGINPDQLSVGQYSDQGIDYIRLSIGSEVLLNEALAPGQSGSRGELVSTYLSAIRTDNGLLRTADLVQFINETNEGAGSTATSEGSAASIDSLIDTTVSTQDFSSQSYGVDAYINSGSQYGFATSNGVNIASYQYTGRLIGSEHNDQFWVVGGPEAILDGRAGVDTLWGGAGTDTLIGGAGDDRLNAGSGDDRYIVTLADGHDRIEENSGNDQIVFAGTGLSEQQIWLQRDGNDLLVLMANANTSAGDAASASQRVVNHFTQSDQAIESLQLGDKALNTAGINTLLGYMADQQRFDLSAQAGSSGQTISQQIASLWQTSTVSSTAATTQVSYGPNLVINGDFEAGSQGWQGSHGLETWYSAGVYGLSNEGHGTAVAELDVNVNTTMSQTLSGLNAGDDIRLQFDFSNRSGYESNNGIRVLWNGQEVFSDADRSAGWQQQTVTVASQQGDNTLAFEGTGGSNSLGYLVDNISANLVQTMASFNPSQASSRTLSESSQLLTQQTLAATAL